MNLICKTAIALTVGIGMATTAFAAELTIAIVYNGHKINMQKVAGAYASDTGTTLN